LSKVHKCTVRFFDRRGIEHSTEVRAASLYEAACRAWSNFKSVEETEEESFKTKEFIVEVHRDPKVFQVDLDKLLAWLERGRRGHKDNPRKQWFRRLLDACLWGPPTAEEEARAARGQSVSHDD
jgi:hypothetical protein